MGYLQAVFDVVAAAQAVRHKERRHLGHDGHAAHAPAIQAVAEAEPVGVTLLPGWHFSRSQKTEEDGAGNSGIGNEQGLVEGPGAGEETAQDRIDRQQHAYDQKIDQGEKFAVELPHKCETVERGKDQAHDDAQCGHWNAAGYAYPRDAEIQSE